MQKPTYLRFLSIASTVLLLLAALVLLLQSAHAAALARTRASVDLPAPPRDAPSSTLTATPTISSTVTSTSTPDCGLAWRIVSAPSPPGANLYGAASASSSDIWAVGTGYSGPHQTLAEHWDGTSWSEIPSVSPGASDNQLFAVAAQASDDVWAVGFNYSENPALYHTLIEHWDGTQWTVTPSPNGGTGINFLYGVAAISATDAWAVGYYADGSGPDQPLALHWNGSQWNGVPTASVLGNNSFWSVAAISSNDVWAVGLGDSGQALAEHWDGTQWTVTPVSSVGQTNELFSVAAGPDSEVWAVGSYSTGAQDHTLVEHWNGTQWTNITSQDLGSRYNLLRGVTVGPAGDVWAVGRYGDGSTEQTLVEYWDGTGFSAIPSPNPVVERNVLVGVVSVAGSVWAVGLQHQDGQDAVLIERYSNPCPPPTNTPSLTPTLTRTPTATPIPLLVGHVTWQGPPAQPHARQQLPITLTLKAGSTEVNYPIQNTDASGFFTVSLGSLVRGPYNWRVKGPKYLANGGLLTLTGAPVQHTEFGLQRAGDANNSNSVNGTDFSILRHTFAFCVGDPDYDARADFDNSNCVSGVDFTLLKNNFGAGGSPPPGP